MPEMILGDSTRIRQIVANLVANAIKFTATGGVHIHLWPGRRGVGRGGGDRGMRVRIQVADSGVGIDPARLPFLFKPFHQADESIGRRFGGTGLGLSIADDLARLMGGRIEATSAVGRGSTFTLVMPLVLAEVPAGFESLLPNGAAAQERPPASKRPVLELVPESAPLAGRTVLVAEDDTANQALVVAMLETCGSARSSPAPDTRRWPASPPIRSTRADGRADARPRRPERDPGLAQARRQQRRGAAVRGDDRQHRAGELAECRAAGMSTILTKPFPLAELKRALVQAI